MFTSCYTVTTACDPATTAMVEIGSKPTIIQRLMQRFRPVTPVVAFSEPTSSTASAKPEKFIKLTGRDLVKNIRALSLWSGLLVKRPHLLREFLFQNSADAVKFVNCVVEKATMLNHFPKIVIVKNKVAITLRTTEIDGISTKDIELARLIEGC